MPGLKSLIGQKFGRLTVVVRDKNIRDKVAYLCKCDCGKEAVVIGSCLQGKRTRSCGCLKMEHIKN